MENIFKPISRRVFLQLSALSAGSMVALSIAPKASAAGDSLQATIQSNHGHRFAATLAEVKAAGPKVYDIQGTARHPHTLDLTQEILETLISKKIVDIESSEDAGHTHIVRLQIL